jgi:hypothetical protein
MRIFSFLILLLLQSCSNDEDFINNFINKNNILVINISKEPIAKGIVLSELDNAFLKKYNFLKNRDEDKNLFIISKINFVLRNNHREYTKISRPIYSENNKYCLLQIIIFNQTIGYSNIIYFLENNNGIWNIVNEFESKLVN